MDTNKKIRRYIQITPGQLEKIKELAYKHKVSFSEIVRRAIDKYLNNK